MSRSEDILGELGEIDLQEKFKKRIREVKGTFLHYYVDEVELADGHLSTRELVIHPGAVTIIALTRKQEVLIVKQYRYPIQRILYELPAGKLEQDEALLVCAQRELKEETGYLARSWEKLASFYTAPGFSSEYMHLYLAMDLLKVQQEPEPGEIITVEKIYLSKLEQMIKCGEIKDGKTVLGILWLLERMRSN